MRTHRISLLLVVSLVTDLGAAYDASAQRRGPPPGPTWNMTGLWERFNGYRAGGDLTEYGVSLTEGLTVMDDPEVFCEGYNVPRSTFSSPTIVKIEETDDRWKMFYEHNAGERDIPLDGETAAQTVRMHGTSVARREGDTIIIETDGFPSGLVWSENLVTSDELRFLERYRMEDEDTLEVFLMLADPQVFEWPRVAHAFWKRLPDDTFFWAEECLYDPSQHQPAYDPQVLERSHIDQ